MDSKIRHLEAYNGNQLTLLGSLTCDVEWNGSKLTQKRLAVAQSDKEFGLLSRDLLPKHGMDNITTELLLAVKRYKAHVKLILANVLLIPDHSQCSAKPERNLYLFKTGSQRSWKRWSDRAYLNWYSQEETLMHLQLCGRERIVENWDFVLT